MIAVIRAFIMLAFLGAAVALYAIGPLPDTAQSMVNRLWSSAKQGFAKQEFGWQGFGKQEFGWHQESGSSRIKAAPRFEPPGHPMRMGSRTGELVQKPGKSEVHSGGVLEDSQLDRMLTQLRQLGATDYRLNHWGSEGLFRFCCTMPLVGYQDQSRQFEAVADDGARAVAMVLLDVEEQRGEGNR